MRRLPTALTGSNADLTDDGTGKRTQPTPPVERPVWPNDARAVPRRGTCADFVFAGLPISPDS